MGPAIFSGPRSSAGFDDDLRLGEYFGGAGGEVGAGADDFAGFELDGPGTRRRGHDAAFGFDEIARVNRGEKLHGFVGREQPFVPVRADEQLGRDVAEEPEDTCAVHQLCRRNGRRARSCARGSAIARSCGLCLRELP